MTNESEQTQELNDEEKAAQEQQAEASFEAGFKRIQKGEPASEDESPEAEQQESQAGEQDQAGEQTAGTEETDEGAEAGASKETKETGGDGDGSANFESFNKRLRDVEGRVGGAVDRMENMLKAIKETTTASGGDTPSDKEISAAAASSEKFKQMKEDFPEFAEAVEEYFAAVSGGLRPNLSEVENSLLSKVGQIMQVREAETRELIKLDNRHPDWEETTVSEDFLKWTLEGGPSLEAYRDRQALDENDPKRKEIENQWAREYPGWWGERGAKVFSPRAQDAISLLDGFKEFKEGKSKGNGDKDEKRQRQEKRLKGATPAAGTSGPTNTQPTDEQLFERGFNKTARAYGRQ